MSSTPGSIEKRIELNAPIGRVWRALTESHQFGAWFGVHFPGRFGRGMSVVGDRTEPGQSGKLALRIVAVEPEHYFAYRWRPHAMARPVVDEDETTLVEFFLEQAGDATRLRVLESGFERIPEAVRAENYRENLAGWDEEAGRLARYVDGDGPVPSTIRKQATLHAPISRVWRAIARPEEFGKWFGLEFAEAEFAPGREMHAKITQPAEYAGTPFIVTVAEVVPEMKLGLRWHPYDPAEGDPTPAVSTLIEFTLEARGQTTFLTVTESGFEDVPERYRVTAFRSNDEGWGIQVENIRKYLDA